MPDRPDYVCCPICHATVFHPVVAECPEGPKSTTRLFACANCTIVCLDPLALTRAFEDRPRSRRPPVDPTPAMSAWARINQRKRERG